MIRVWEQEAEVGLLTIATSDEGVCLVQFATERHSASADRLLREAVSQQDHRTADAFAAYFAGDPEPLDAVPVDLALVDGQTHRKILTLLRERTSFGQTVTYGGLAEWAGMPGAAQAIGRMMGANPVPVIVPCHRVVAADGSLGGFSGGLDTKRTLFRIEGIPARAGGWSGPDPNQQSLF